LPIEIRGRPRPVIKHILEVAHYWQNATGNLDVVKEAETIGWPIEHTLEIEFLREVIRVCSIPPTLQLHAISKRVFNPLEDGAILMRRSISQRRSVRGMNSHAA